MYINKVTISSIDNTGLIKGDGRGIEIGNNATITNFTNSGSIVNTKGTGIDIDNSTISSFSKSELIKSDGRSKGSNDGGLLNKILLNML